MCMNKSEETIEDRLRGQIKRERAVNAKLRNELAVENIDWKNVLLDVLEEVDADIAKDYTEETAECPEEAWPLMCRLIAVAKKSARKYVVE